MAQLKMSVDIKEFDLTHVIVKMAVLDKRGRSTMEKAGPDGDFVPSSAELRMTLPELHIFLRALLEFKGPIELTTPTRDRKKAAEAGGTRETFLDDALAPVNRIIVDAAE